MPDSSTVCPACGARLAADASACDLCGHDLALPTDDDLLDEGDALDLPVPVASPAAPVAAKGRFCTHCGASNPPGAKFCSECGTALVGATPVRSEHAPRLTAASAVAAPPVEAPTGQRLWLMVGTAVLLVAGLFAITVANKDNPRAGAQTSEEAPVAASGGAAAPSESTAPPSELATLTPAQTATLDSLAEAANALTGAAQLDKQRELARMQFGFGRPDLAGQTMEAVAAASNTPDDWRTAGNFLYQWMETLPEDQREPSATRVVAAYERVLAAEDGDLDSRTRLSWAAQYAPGDNPMRSVQEMQEVLRRDSNHVGANFNRAFLLLKIGRYDQALAQLRKVQRLAGADSPLGRQAAQLIAAIEQQQGSASGEAGS